MIDNDLRVGDWVTIPHKEFGDITFIVIGEDHDAPDTVTLLTRDIMKILPFDAMERTNPDKSRQKGNNRYIHSNIRQWLNSDAEAGNWYKPQHEYDEEPCDVNVVHGVSYVESPGLLNGFSDEFKSRLVTVHKTVAYFGNKKMDYVYDVFDDKVFLLSNAEVGLSGETGIRDGKVYEYFIDEGSGSSNRIARVSDYCFEHTNRKYGFKAGRQWYWWLRTPYTEVPYMSNYIGQNGYLCRDMVYKGNGLRFALVISKK